ncbi:hypothetical protein [Krasilnikovia sp. M28-CT-15]|uniref:hypothetical protein n=1 Tax=Krasilnikovia sp. M28-CT-15 TaxID=3373540 RepID=UPI00399D291F
MRRLRLLLPLAVVIGVVLAGPTAASADPYVPGEEPTVAAPASVPAGSPIVIRGSGYIPFETVQIFLASVNTTLVAHELSAAERSGGPVPVAFVAPLRRLPAPGTLIGATTADSNGDFVFTVPASVTDLVQGGVLNLTAAGVTSGTLTGFTVRVTPLSGGGQGAGPGGGPGGGGQGSGETGNGETGNGLPVTGTDGGQLTRQVMTGVVLAAVGVVLLWLAAPSRRRRRRQPDPVGLGR